MQQGIRLTETEIAALYYYHVDSSINFTKEMNEAYTMLVQKIRDHHKGGGKKTPAKPDKIWEALKGVVG